MLKDVILEDFDTALPLIGSQAQEVRRFLESKLYSLTNLKVHSVSMRIKSRESLSAKLGRPESTYNHLWDITDLIGLRVSVYFEDSVEIVAKLIETFFPIDFRHSVIKGPSQGAAFGYRSHHYVSGFGLSSLKTLPENARFEIQIRTILQHAWAEVEHDLGYKVNDTIPSDIRRRFSRVAGLLEIADQEFCQIRNDLDLYAQSVSTRLASGDETVPLDRFSLVSLLDSQEAKNLDSSIAKLMSKPIDTEPFYPEYLLKMMRLSGIDSVLEAKNGILKYESKILALIAPYFRFTSSVWMLSTSSIDKVPRGYGLFFLAHVLIYLSPILGLSKVQRLTQFYRELDYPNDERAAQNVASKLISVLSEAIDSR